MKKIIGSLAFVLIAVLVACGPSQEKTNDIKLPLTAEGPFFAGPTSLMHEFKPDLKALMGDDAAKLKELKLKDISVNLPEGSPYSWDDFTSASLVFVSDNSPMTSVAILNPIKSNGTNIVLTTSEDADLVEFFKEEKFTILLDLDFIEDIYEDVINADLTMNLVFKY